MTNVDKWNEDEMRDCLSDGPLSPALLAELVQACDEQPELWKRCALVLLEEQVLRQELQSMAREQLVQSEVPRAVCSQSVGELELVVSSPSSGDGDNRKTSSSGVGSDIAFWNVLAMAATVLIAMGIGWQASQRFGLRDRVADQIRNSEAYVSAPLPIDLAMPEQSDAMLAQSDSVVPAIIEQFNVESLANVMRVDWKENLDPEYQQLRERGFEVQSQEGLIPVWLSDGRSAAVPYELIKLRPKSSSSGGAY